jgi:hypothetical protein
MVHNSQLNFSACFDKDHVFSITRDTDSSYDNRVSSCLIVSHDKIREENKAEFYAINEGGVVLSTC